MARTKRTYGYPVAVEVEVYDTCKYFGLDGKKEYPRVEYKDLDFWEIVDGEDAEKLEAETDGSCIDDFHEYLVLHFVDGDTSTFRNSYVDMFRLFGDED